MSTVPDRERQFAELVVEHQAGLRSFIRMLGVAAWAVDDLAQETFLVALRRLDDFDPALPAGPWLRGIARNIVRSHVRAKGGRGKTINLNLAEVLAAGTDERLSETLPLDGLEDHLRACLDRLPAHAREMIANRYGDEGGPATMRLNDNALRQSLFRVRETLRRCILGRIETESQS